jgi:hypothetical protein
MHILYIASLQARARRFPASLRLQSFLCFSDYRNAPSQARLRERLQFKKQRRTAATPSGLSFTPLLLRATPSSTSMPFITHDRLADTKTDPNVPAAS